MKTIFLFISIFFAGMAMSSCTNDEGEEDIDVITPNEEENSFQPILESSED